MRATSNSWQLSFRVSQIPHSNLNSCEEMESDLEQATEQTQLLPRAANQRRASRIAQDEVLASHLSKEEQSLRGTPIGERLPYNDYATIDWLRDLVRYLVSIANSHTHILISY